MAGPSVKELRAQFEQIAHSQQSTNSLGSKQNSRLGSSWTSRQVSRTNTSTNFSSSEPTSSLKHQFASVKAATAAPLQELPSETVLTAFGNLNNNASADVNTESVTSARLVREQFEFLAKSRSFRDDRPTAIANRSAIIVERDSSARGSQSSLNLQGAQSGLNIKCASNVKPPQPASAVEKRSNLKEVALSPGPLSAPPAVGEPSYKAIAQRINETLNRIQEKVVHSRTASTSSTKAKTPKNAGIAQQEQLPAFSRFRSTSVSVSVYSDASKQEIPAQEADGKPVANEESQEFTPSPPSNAQGEGKGKQGFKRRSKSLSGTLGSVAQQDRINDSTEKAREFSVQAHNLEQVSENLEQLDRECKIAPTVAVQQEATAEAVFEALEGYGSSQSANLKFDDRLEFPSDRQSSAPSLEDDSGLISAALQQLEVLNVQVSDLADEPLTFSDANNTSVLSTEGKLSHNPSVHSNKFSRPKRQRRRTGSISEAAYLREQTDVEVAQDLNRSAIAPEVVNFTLNSSSSSNVGKVPLELAVNNNLENKIIVENLEEKENLAVESTANRLSTINAEQSIIESYSQLDTPKNAKDGDYRLASVDAASAVNSLNESATAPTPVRAAEKSTNSRFSLKSLDQWKHNAAAAVSNALQATKNRLSVSPQGKGGKSSPKGSPRASEEKISPKVGDQSSLVGNSDHPAQKTLEWDAHGVSADLQQASLESKQPRSISTTYNPTESSTNASLESNSAAVDEERNADGEGSTQISPPPVLNFRDRLTNLLAKGPALPNQSLGGSLVTYEQRETANKLSNITSLSQAAAIEGESGEPEFYEVFEEEPEAELKQSLEFKEAASKLENGLCENVKDSCKRSSAEELKLNASSEASEEQISGTGIKKKFGDAAFVNKITFGLMKNTVQRPKKDNLHKHEPLADIFSKPVKTDNQALPPQAANDSTNVESAQPSVEENTLVLSTVTKSFQKPRRPGRSSSISRK